MYLKFAKTLDLKSFYHLFQVDSLSDEPLGSPGSFSYFLDFDLSRIRVELAERNFMTRMDRYITVNW